MLSMAGLGGGPGGLLGLKSEHIQECLSNDSLNRVTFSGDYQSFGR